MLTQTHADSEQGSQTRVRISRIMVCSLWPLSTALVLEMVKPDTRRKQTSRIKGRPRRGERERAFTKRRESLLGCARLLSYAHWIQAGLGLFALPEIPWTSVRCAAPRMVLHGRGLPALRRTPSLTRMGLLLSLQLAFSQVKPLECPGAGATLKNKGQTISTAVPCPVKVPQAAWLLCLGCWISQCGLREWSVSAVLPEAPHFLVVLGS